MRFDLLPVEVRNALTQRGCSENDVSLMSAEEVFHEFCLWGVGHPRFGGLPPG